jgi:hypothetical protein
LLKVKSDYVVMLMIVFAVPLLPLQAYSKIPYFHDVGSSEIQGRDSNSTKFVILNFYGSNGLVFHEPCVPKEDISTRCQVRELQ